MHRNLHTVKEMKLNIPKTMSEPPRNRQQVKLLKKKAKKQKVDISVISNKKKDVSFVSEFIF